ncbi:MAG: TRAP transporter small permease [Deltaproteobacteria bacterium]|nr:TRAP transporter small permease [Deltaproteobacteria bacterium]
MFQKIEKYIYRLVNYALVLQGIGLIILIGLEVFFRYVIGNALSWPEEVAGIFFIWFTLLGVAAVVREDDHIAFDFLMKHTPPAVGKIIKLFCMLMIQVYAFFLIYQGYSYASMFSFETTPAARINLLWMTLSLPISGLLIIIFSLLKIVGIFKPAERSGS